MQHAVPAPLEVAAEQPPSRSRARARSPASPSPLSSSARSSIALLPPKSGSISGWTTRQRAAERARVAPGLEEVRLAAGATRTPARSRRRGCRGGSGSAPWRRAAPSRDRRARRRRGCRRGRRASSPCRPAARRRAPARRRRRERMRLGARSRTRRCCRRCRARRSAPRPRRAPPPAGARPATITLLPALFFRSLATAWSHGRRSHRRPAAPDRRRPLPELGRERQRRSAAIRPLGSRSRWSAVMPVIESALSTA